MENEKSLEMSFEVISLFDTVPVRNNITIEFMFAGINMFWTRLRLILARAARLSKSIEDMKGKFDKAYL